MLQERDDIVALDSAILQHPRVWEASGHLEGFTDPLVDCRACKQRFRADHVDPDEMCPAKANLPKTEDRRHELHRGARLQPHVQDVRRPRRGDRVGHLPAAGDGAGHLHQLQERPAVQPPQAAVRHRADRQVVPQRDHARATSSSARASSSRWRWSSSCRRPRRGDWYAHWKNERFTWYEDLGIRTDHLRLREHDADELSHYSSGTADVEYLFPIGWSELEGIANRGDFDLTRHARVQRREARVLRPGDRRPLRPARHRARRRRRPRDARVPRRRLRRGGGRGRVADRAAAAPAAGAGEGRRAAARAQGRPAGAGARGARVAARAHAVPSTTRAARSAGATAARTRSARRGA